MQNHNCIVVHLYYSYLGCSHLELYLRHCDRELAELKEKVSKLNGQITELENRVVGTTNPSQHVGPHVVKHSQHPRIPGSPGTEVHHRTMSRTTTRSIGRSISEEDVRLLRTRYADKAKVNIFQTLDNFLTRETSVPASGRSTELEDTHTAFVGNDQSMKTIGCLPYSTPGVSPHVSNFPLLGEPAETLHSLCLDRENVEDGSSEDDVYSNADSLVPWDCPFTHNAPEPASSFIYGIEEYIDLHFPLNFIISCVLVASIQSLWPA